MVVQRLSPLSNILTNLHRHTYGARVMYTLLGSEGLKVRK